MKLNKRQTQSLHSPWSPESQTILLTSQTNSWGVNYGHESLDIRGQHSVKKLLIPVLQCHKNNIPLKQNKIVIFQYLRLFTVSQRAVVVSLSMHSVLPSPDTPLCCIMSRYSEQIFPEGLASSAILSDSSQRLSRAGHHSHAQP